MIDLDNIKVRAQALQQHAGTTDYASQVIRENVELVAEVERLRGAAHTADTERAAIVRWLRACEDESCVFADDIASQFAAEIERGEHVKGGDE